MTKWFDTNYHYLIPEFLPETAFSLASERPFAEVEEVMALGHRVKAVLVGPLTFLWRGKEKVSGFERLSLLDAQRALYAAEQDLIAVRLAESANRVTLYKALGGGWHEASSTP